MADQAAAFRALDDTMGVLYLGVAFAMALWGASTFQVYHYYNRYTKDEFWIKGLVAIVWALNTVHQGLITHMIYTYLVTNYSSPSFLGTVVNSLLIEVTFSGIIIFLVQAFFILRAWKLSHRNMILASILACCSAGNLVLAIVYTQKSLQKKTFARVREVFGLSRAVNIMGVVSDGLITAVLIYLLHRSRSGFKRSERIINRLILFTLNTGLLTALDALASLVSNTVAGDTFIYILFFMNVSRLYTNSLMSTLNSRRDNVGVDESTPQQSLVVSNRGYCARAVEFEAPSAVNNNIRTLSIKVNTESEIIRDQEERNVTRGTPSESFSDVPYSCDSMPNDYPMH